MCIVKYVVGSYLSIEKCGMFKLYQIEKWVIWEITSICTLKFTSLDAHAMHVNPIKEERIMQKYRRRTIIDIRNLYSLKRSSDI